MVFPGGFGAAKNLSTWAVDGTKCTVEKNVEKIINNFHTSKKPIALSCIAPVLAAKVLGDQNIKNVQLTVGSEVGGEGTKWPYAATAGQIKSLGCTHVSSNFDGICIDNINKLVTVPAYMFEGKPHEIYDNMSLLIDGLYGFF